MNHKILVTGGAGYIGSILVPELLRAGCQVTVLDNFMYDQNSLSHVCSDPNFRVVRGDARSKTAMTPLMREADIIIPLAAIVGAPACDRDPVAATSTNKGAIEDLARWASGDQWILMPTTNSGYGIGEKDKLCTEKTPLKPITLYGRDKAAAEEAILSRNNSISFRLATAFGMSPRMRIDLLVNDFTYRALYDGFVVLFEGHFHRNFIHVRDIARAFLHGIKHFEEMKGEAYNVGLSDANITKRELCERIRKHLPGFVVKEEEMREDPDKRDYIVSNEKIEKTGFKPAYSLDDGISELIKGYAMIKDGKYANA